MTVEQEARRFMYTGHILTKYDVTPTQNDAQKLAAPEEHVNHNAIFFFSKRRCGAHIQESGNS